ncbi:MAG: hypothetical protein K8F25_02635, partial [Fimbriimonadaceae bacterium]|nr:hypothetical protein [Alphaproteobacteria bacterium]
LQLIGESVVSFLTSCGLFLQCHFHGVFVGREIALPGYYMRQRQDPACWSNSETNTSICAW